MRILKVITGSVCLVAACGLGLFTWVSFTAGGSWFALVITAFLVGLISIGLLLIVRQRSPLPSFSRGLIAAFFVLLILAPVILDVWIRHNRHELQKRSQQFLSRPTPKMLIPDSEGYVGGYFVDTNSGPANGVFGYSLILIERYATKGRIRWSARIQAQFACIGEGVNPNIRSDAIETNEEVRLYLAERNAILAKEWRMGFWQWVEDTIEMKSKIPEHEEEG
jgi:fumarate reductase subunit D